MGGIVWISSFHYGPGDVLQAMWASQLQAAAESAALREAEMRANAINDERRLAAADRAMEKGDVVAAVRMYLHLTSRHPPNESSQAAVQRLMLLKIQARQKMNGVIRELALGPGIQVEPSSPGLTQSDSAPTETTGSRWADTVVASLDKILQEPREAELPVQNGDIGISEVHILVTFRKFDRLIVDYGDVPEIGSEIKTEVTKLRSKPEYAAVLKESAAKKLWAQGQKFEDHDSLCCAYWVYKGAKELLPAPSAVLASKRFAELAKDPAVVAAAARCRELQECHRLYCRAEHLSTVDRDGARKLFADVLRRAPEDSEVYREAERQLQ